MTEIAPTCAAHPKLAARPTPCSRCGDFACEACFGDPKSMRCAACRGVSSDTDVSGPEEAGARPTFVKPILMGLGVCALNVASIVVTDRNLIFAFPLGFTVLGLGAVGAMGAIFGRPRTRAHVVFNRVFFACAVLGGLFAGIALNLLISG